jgi:hypothetical protein
MTPQALQIEVSHGQYVLQGLGGWPPAPPHAGGNGLIWAGQGAAVVMTGQDDGDIALNVEALATRPPAELTGWDDVVEICLTLIGNTLAITPPTSYEPSAEVLLPATAGQQCTYRLRLHTRGRDQAREQGPVYAEDGDAMLEHHLLLIWPAPYTEPAILKLTDAVGAELRARNRL